MDFNHRLVAMIPAIRIWAIAWTRSHDHAEDLVRSTTLTALRRRSLYRGSVHPGRRHAADTSLATWLHRIMIDHLTSAPRNRSMTITPGGRGEPAVDPDDVDSIPLCELSLGVSCLTGGQREALFMVVLQAMSCEAAARIAGCSAGAMAMRVRRTRAMLRKWLIGDERDDLDDAAGRCPEPGRGSPLH